VESQPVSGYVGGAVRTLGTNLTGTTAVTFNGVAATFKVVSSSEIVTRVPVGAGTGFIHVVVPSGAELCGEHYSLKIIVVISLVRIVLVEVEIQTEEPPRTRRLYPDLQ
jgi:hypothetical protein